MCWSTQRTMLINAIRGHAAEIGVTVAKARPWLEQGGPKAKFSELLQRLAADAGVPALAREVIGVLSSQLEALENKLK